jgi:protocatechuate 3,4-dioxygenase beta subunit
MRGAAAIWWAVLVVLVLGVWQSLDLASAATPTSAPTRPGSLGPFYEPNAPERDSTRQGLSISGIVRSAKDCHALGGARLKWWSANARGDYNATHRATQQASSDGHSHYTTDFSGRYPGRPPHLHVRVAAPGHRMLITQAYPQRAQTALGVDLVLVPE